MIALFAAMGMEISSIRKRLTIDGVSTAGGCRIERAAHGSLPLLIVEFGIGRRRAECAASVIASHPEIDSIVSLGFAGALAPDMRVGDLVLCPTARSSSDAATYASDDALLALARAAAGRMGGVREAGCVSVEAFVSKPEEKLALAEAHGAGVVEMETYWIARAATDRGLPFLSVRVVSDSATEKLPPIERFIDLEGRWQWGRMSRYFLPKPWRIAELFTLARMIGKARANLTEFTDRLLSLYGESNSR